MVGSELIPFSKVKYQHKPDLTNLRLTVSSHATWCWVARKDAKLLLS